MKRKLFFSLTVLITITVSGYSQTKSFWTQVAPAKAAVAGKTRQVFVSAGDSALTFATLDAAGFKNMLAKAPQKDSAEHGIRVAVPNTKGSIEYFNVVETSNFSTGLQAKFPDIRSYAGTGVDDPTAYLRLSISPKGVQSMVLRSGGESEFIEPYTDGNEVYAVFHSGSEREFGKLPFRCTTVDVDGEHKIASLAAREALSSDKVFRTMRLALSCTGEYAAYHGGTVADALAAMNATMTRVNGIFEKDLALHLNLIDSEASIIFTNSNTDPYSNAINMDNWNSELQATLTRVIGEGAYDIGHLFGATGGGGNAGCIGCVCVDGQKGSGITSPANGIPEGDKFDVDYVAHELGHQLGANHTYSHINEGSGVQTEPGSGSTIMGYAGITNYNVQQNSDDYFTYASIRQIQSNLATKSCPQTTPLNNPGFTVSAGNNYSIPRGTPFVLTGTGTDNPAITYTWEQYDSAGGNTSGGNSVPSPTKTSGPNFRSLPPSASAVRYMPDYNTVLANSLTTTWETVSTVARTLNFTLTGRDNVAGGGQTQTDQMTVTVRSGAGPFAVTSQNEDYESWAVNSQQTITWDVAGTTGNNVNTANVNILLSADGGQTFPIVLASNTPNDGSEVITVPQMESSLRCRIKIAAVGNIYYALSQKEFAIGYEITNVCNTYTSNTPINIPDGASTYTTQDITIPDTGNTATSVTVTVNATHSALGDLTINMLNPTNTLVTLWNRQCSSSSGMNITFSDNGNTVQCGSPTTGTYKAQGNLTTYTSRATAGNWRLRVRDSNAGVRGTINSWSVELCTQTIRELSAEDFGLTGFSLYPNPSNGSFTVQFTSKTTNNINVLVHDIRGRLVYNNSFTNTGLFSGNVNLDNAEKGVYLVTVADGNHKETRKIMVN